MPNAVKLMISPATRVAAAKTRPFAASIARRCGTAARVARIMPVPYSELMVSTPSAADGDLGDVEAVEAGQGGVETVAGFVGRG